MFADDTCLFYNFSVPLTAQTNINNDLKNIKNWSELWKVKFNAVKTKFMIVENKKCKTSLYLNLIM